MITVKVKRLTETAKIPTKSDEEAAGFDLYTDEDGVLDPGDFKMVSTGIALDIPNGYWCFIRPRSGVATKNLVTTCSSDVLDSNFQFELKLCLINLHKTKTFRFLKGQRLGQFVIIPQPKVKLEENEDFRSVSRGTGFGSSGK